MQVPGELKVYTNKLRLYNNKYNKYITKVHSNTLFPFPRGSEMKCTLILANWKKRS